MSNHKKVHLQIRIEEDLKRKFHEVNRSKSVNGSDLIRRWIEEYVAKEEGQR